jgi:hypothetical protein
MSQEYFLPLYTAVISQDITLVTEIISSTPPVDRLEMVNSRDSSNSTPLHLAISTGNASMLELLLENGADTELLAPNNYGDLIPNYEASCLASRVGDVEILRNLLDKQSLVNTETLYNAAGCGRVECVEEILGRVARGCGFKYKVSRQPGIENAITAAVLEWRVEVLRLLIAAPEFTHSAKVLDRSLLSLACSYNLDQYHLLNRVKKDTSEGQAMQVQVYGILLECGANVNATQTYEDGSSDNLTVLHLICRGSRTPRKELWEMLLEYGANIHGLDIYGRIPLFCAVQEDNAELVARMILLG